MLRLRFTSSAVGRSAFPATTALLCTSARTMYGHDLKGEGDRAGPARVPSMDKKGRLFDPAVHDEDRYWEEKDAESRKQDEELHRMRDSYYNFGGGNTKMSPDGDTTGSQKGHQDGDTHPFGQQHYSAGETYEGAQGISGSIHDRENLRVRGQRVPDDVPLTDEEVDAHPAARRLRTFGVGAIVIILYVAQRAMRDPFDEGDYFSRYRCKPDGNDRDMMPWLLPKNSAAMASGDPRQVMFAKGKEDLNAINKHGDLWKAGRANDAYGNDKPWK